MLQFLNSGFLFLAAAAVIPLLIHLFARRRPQVIVFSSIRHIKNSMQKQNRRINLKNLLLLIIRILIILFTVMALARPTLKLGFLKNSDRHPRTAVAIILDNSYSMEYLVDTSTALDIAKRQALEAGNLLNENDYTVLLTLDSQWNRINSYLKSGRPDEKLVQGIDISPLVVSPEEAVERAEEQLRESQLPNREIWFFTDRQLQKYPQSSETPLFVIRVADYDAQNNLSCQNAALRVELIDRTLEHEIRFEVVNHSTADQNGILCQLNLDGRTIAEQALDVASMQTKTGSFAIGLEQPGWHNGFISVKNERLLYDNRSWFTFYHDPDPTVAVLSDAPSLPLALRSILNVYSGHIDFLPDNIDSGDLASYNTVLVYRKAYSPRLDFLLQGVPDRLLFIADSLLADDWQNFIGFDFTNYHRDSERTIDQVSAFHPVTSVFDRDKLQSTRVNGFWDSRTTNLQGDILMQTGNSPLAISGDKGLFWLFDPADLGNPFLLDSAFPVFAYRCLQSQSTSGLQQGDLRVGDLLPRNHRQVRQPDGSQIQGGILTQTGIYHDLDSGAQFAVNLRYDESRFKLAPEEGSNITWLDKAWQKEILQSRYGFELWKYLLIAALALFILEMLLVRSMERSGETK